MDLDGKRVVITGGATGIGRATAMYCAGKGARVVVADVSRRDAEDCVAQIRSAGGEGWFLHADVSSEPEVESMMAEAERLMGGIDALVTAGVRRCARC